jgi:hypothetical protein
MSWVEDLELYLRKWHALFPLQFLAGTPFVGKIIGRCLEASSLFRKTFSTMSQHMCVHKFGFDWIYIDRSWQWERLQQFLMTWFILSRGRGSDAVFSNTKFFILLQFRVQIGDGASMCYIELMSELCTREKRCTPWSHGSWPIGLACSGRNDCHNHRTMMEPRNKVSSSYFYPACFV